MTRRSVAFFWVVGLVLAVAAPLAAQTTSVRSVIPFDFTVGAKLLPAGEYIIRFDQQFEALSFTAVGSDVRASLPARWMSSGPNGASSQAKVVFNRYESNYFLSEVWDGSRSGPFYVPPSKQERELARLEPSAQVTLLARR
jgi:hypothetical protein